MMQNRVQKVSHLCEVTWFMKKIILQYCGENSGLFNKWYWDYQIYIFSKRILPCYYTSYPAEKKKMLKKPNFLPLQEKNKHKFVKIYPVI